jgi:hypothetical protein
MLEAIEASEDSEVDPSVLLPNPAVDLPPVPEEDPHGFDSEPVTQKDHGKKEKREATKKEAPPSLPPKPQKIPVPEAPALGAPEARQAEAMPPPPTEEVEKKEEKPAEDSTPPPFEPAARVRSSYQRFLIPGAIAASVLIVVLIIILAWPSGEGDEPAAGELRTSISPADVTPEPTAAESDGEAADSKPDLAVMEIVTDPAGCLVFLDGMRLRGKTPLANVFIPANTEYKVVVKCKGFKKESREIIARPGERLQVKIIPPPK